MNVMETANIMQKKSWRKVKLDIREEKIGTSEGRYDLKEKAIRLSTSGAEKMHLKMKNEGADFKSPEEIAEYILAHEFGHANHLLFPFYSKIIDYLSKNLAGLILKGASKKKIRRTMRIFGKLLLHTEIVAWKKANRYLLTKIGEKEKEHFREYCLGTYRDYCKSLYKFVLIARELSRRFIQFKTRVGFVDVYFDFQEKEKESIYDRKINKLLVNIRHMIDSKNKAYESKMSPVDYLFCQCLYLINGKNFEGIEKLLIDEQRQMKIFREITESLDKEKMKEVI